MSVSSVFRFRIQRELLFFPVSFQQFGKILDVEIIFNERGSKVRDPPTSSACSVTSMSMRPEKCFLNGTELIERSVSGTDDDRSELFYLEITV